METLLWVGKSAALCHMLGAEEVVGGFARVVFKEFENANVNCCAKQE